MAFDVFKGTCCARDWSIGAAEDETSKVEVWSVPQIKALGEVVEREVNHNVAIAQKRLQSGSLDKAEGKEFARFARGFKAWWETQKKKTPAGKAVDTLKKWRSENARWTTKLSETSRRGMVILRSVDVTMMRPKEATNLPMIIATTGMVGLGLGLLLARRA